MESELYNMHLRRGRERRALMSAVRGQGLKTLNIFWMFASCDCIC